MKTIFASLLILFQVSLALAQTVTDGETKVLKVFYVKEGTNSPYQGLIQLTPDEYSKIKPADLKTKQLEQFNNWKLALEQLKNKSVVEPTVDEKVARVKELRLEADAIAADPAVAAKLEAAPAVKVK